MDPTHHQEKILTARSKLSLLLRRCLTPATIQHPQPNLQGLQTYRRIQPIALQNGCGPTTDSLWSLPDNRQYNTGIYPNIPNTGRYPDAHAPSTKALHDGIPTENPLWEIWLKPASITTVGSQLLLLFKYQTSSTYLKFQTSNLPPQLSATLRHGPLSSTSISTTTPPTDVVHAHCS